MFIYIYLFVTLTYSCISVLYQGHFLCIAGGKTQFLIWQKLNSPPAPHTLYVFEKSGERGPRERIISRLHVPGWDQMWGWIHDPEIMTWGETKSYVLNWLSLPGAPKP